MQARKSAWSREKISNLHRRSCARASLLTGRHLEAMGVDVGYFPMRQTLY
jgi:hypothetical protein